MMLARLKAGFVATLMCVAACAPTPETKANFFVFGTLVEVAVRGADAGQAESAFTEIQQALQRMHRDWHAWEPGLLTEINRAFAEARRTRAPEDIDALIRMSQQMERESGGRFNAAAGGLVRLWGFHTSDYPVSGPPPSGEAISAWLETAPSTLQISTSDGWLESSNRAVQLDFGGIAKGYAVDRVIEILARHGIGSAIVNAGGDLRAVGGSAADPWRVGIRKPGGGVAAGLEIDGDSAVFTSGIDQRYRQQDGKRYPHILDPRSGQAISGLASVTVVSQDAWRADAAATALMVAGPGEWRALARDMKLDKVLVINEAGDMIATPAMARSVILEPGQSGHLQISNDP